MARSIVGVLQVQNPLLSRGLELSCKRDAKSEFGRFSGFLETPVSLVRNKNNHLATTCRFLSSQFCPHLTTTRLLSSNAAGLCSSPQKKKKNGHHSFHRCAGSISASQSATSPADEILEEKRPRPRGEDAEGLIFQPGERGSWDSGAVAGPVVRRYLSDNEERWCMWYHGRASAGKQGALPLADSSFGSVGLAESSNGILWSRGGEKVVTDQYGNGGVGMVMEPNSDWWTFDTRHVRVSDVQIMSSEVVRAQSGVYWLYYSGGDAEELELPELLTLPGGPQPGTTVEGLRQRPGLAMSQDGKNWARIEGDHHSGALFDVGGEGEWDALLIGSPQVVFHVPRDLRMFYYSFDIVNQCFSIGLARSKEGVRWQKMGRVLQPGSLGDPDEKGVAAPHVVADPQGDGYFMAFEAVAADGRRRIGVARSKEGLFSWAKAEEPVLEPSNNEAAWDSHSVTSPCLVHMEGDRWRLYYVGYDQEGSGGIGMAESVGGVKGPYRRWRQADLPSV